MSTTSVVARRLVGFFNATNINDVISITQQSGPNFGLATAIVLPRIVAFSARYIF